MNWRTNFTDFAWGREISSSQRSSIARTRFALWSYPERVGSAGLAWTCLRGARSGLWRAEAGGAAADATTTAAAAPNTADLVDLVHEVVAAAVAEVAAEAAWAVVTEVMAVETTEEWQRAERRRDMRWRDWLAGYHLTWLENDEHLCSGSQ